MDHAVPTDRSVGVPEHDEGGHTPTNTKASKKAPRTLKQGSLPQKWMVPQCTGASCSLQSGEGIAVTFCDYCNAYMCEVCFAQHKELFADHVVTIITKKVTVELLSVSAARHMTDDHQACSIVPSVL
jgi:hypothetical protein